jgi:hypothetical protein
VPEDRESKAYRAQPALAEGEGTSLQYRQWMRQFYAA